MTFAYKVRDPEGNILTGTAEGDTKMAVAERLRGQGLLPITIDLTEGGQKAATSAAAGWQRHVPGLGRPGKVKLKEVAILSRQFSTMISSGLSLLRTLNILAEQTESRALAGVVATVRGDVERGVSLSQALAAHPKVFGRLYVAMIRAGETGGVLDTVLLKLAETLESQVALKQKIKSAMTYPVVVFVMVILIVAAMLMFVVPMFEAMYSQLGGTLPAPTRLLIGVSEVVTGFAWILVPAAVGGGVALRRYAASPKGRHVLDALLLRVPIFGPLFHKVALSRFSQTLAVLMASGVPILQALEIVSETVGNSVMSTAIVDVQRSVKEGQSIAKPLGSHKIFPPMVVQMLAVGEETGALDTMLNKIGEFYDQEVEATVDALTSLIEPVLIAFMGATVGGMIVALYMPMFKITELVQ
ncbi:MAG: type II secretion system F family protein [Actinomycetota bacterium]